MMTDKPRPSSPAVNGRRLDLCPWWLGPLLASPLRRLVTSPEKLLSPLVSAGMTVVEPGCGMGFFSIPMARMVGAGGVVVAVDLQPQMIAGLGRRARRAGVESRIEGVSCGRDDLGLRSRAGTADLAVVIYTLHEVPDQARFLEQLFCVLRPGGQLLLVEPKGHVTPEDFADSLRLARQVGFEEPVPYAPGGRLSVLLRKP